MRKIGFIISKKENENRRAIVFEDLKKIKNLSELYFQENYFLNFGFSDNDVREIGANVRVYKKDEEEEFKKDLEKYDVLVNAILWDTNRKDHIIYKEDLKRLKKDCIIVDISCDRNGGIQTCIPTTIENPTYFLDGILHYAVDHTPSFLYKDASKSISEEVVKYIDILVESQEENNLVLSNAIIIKNGNIIDEEINIFQNRAK